MSASPQSPIVQTSTRLIIHVAGAVLGFAILASCEELVETDAPDNLVGRDAVFENDSNAMSAMAGIYIKLASSQSFAGGGSSSVTVLQALYGDELISYAPTASSTAPFYLNSVSPTNTRISGLWQECYNIIYSCNSVIDGLAGSKGASPALKQQLTGEALFVRAFCHFYLTNLFGDIPYLNTTDYSQNAAVTRMPVNDVLMAIIADLRQASDLLSDDYRAERIYPNKSATAALLARAYLYNGDWAGAETEASKVISNTAQYTLLQDLNGVFLKNSLEAIWQLPPALGNYTNEGSVFILLAPPTNVALRADLNKAFESGDQRQIDWIRTLSSSSGLTKWYYPFKYKEKLNATGAEYSMVLRLAEQYLIRAEARIQLDKLTGVNSAEDDLNTIRARAHLLPVTVTTKAELLAIVEKERRMELFTEWGHRYFDLRRSGHLDAVLDPIKTNWDATDALLPIPRSEILANPRLTQNSGY